jgi:hypothetical protein
VSFKPTAGSGTADLKKVHPIVEESTGRAYDKLP